MSTDSSDRIIQIEIRPAETISRMRVGVLVEDVEVFGDELNVSSANARRKFADAAAAKVDGLSSDAIERKLIACADRFAAVERDEKRKARRARGEGMRSIPNIEIIGQDSHGRVVLMAKDTGRIASHHLKSLSYDEFVLFAGRRFKDRFVPNAMPKIREFIAIKARAHDLSLLSKHGQGFSMVGERLIVTSGTSALSWNGATATKLTSPIVGKCLLDFDPGREWCRLERVRRVTSDMTPKKLEAIRARLARLFQGFQFQHAMDSEMFLALALASPLASIWHVRPQVAITGRSNCGKTTACNVLADLLGRLAYRCSGSVTAAALRRSVGQHNLVPLMDEFEDGPERTKILELYRTATRGGNVQRAQSARGVEEFRVSWLSFNFSIELSLPREADRNRFIRLDLLGIDHDPPSCREIVAMRDEFFGLALWLAMPARNLAEQIRLTKLPEVPSRLIEIYAVPAAILCVLTHAEPTSDLARDILRRLLDNRASVQLADLRDEDELLQEILFSPARFRPSTDTSVTDGSQSVEATIGQLLGSGEDATQLERLGVKKGDDGDVFLVGKQLRKTKLCGTKWASLDIDGLLARLPGAQRNRRRIAGAREYGVDVPADALELTLNAHAGDCPRRDAQWDGSGTPLNPMAPNG